MSVSRISVPQGEIVTLHAYELHFCLTQGTHTNTLTRKAIPRKACMRRKMRREGDISDITVTLAQKATCNCAISCAGIHLVNETMMCVYEAREFHRIVGIYGDYLCYLCFCSL